MPQDKQSQMEIRKTKIQHKYFCTSFSLCNLSLFSSVSRIFPKLSFLALHIYLFIFRKNNYNIKTREEQLGFSPSASPYIRRGLETPSASSTWRVTPSQTSPSNTECFKQLAKTPKIQTHFKLKRLISAELLPSTHAMHSAAAISSHRHSPLNNVVAKLSSALGRASPEVASKAGRATAPPGQQGQPGDRHRSHRPTRFCHGCEVHVELQGLTAVCTGCTEVSPAHKQQLPAWLRLHSCKCHQSREHNSGFVCISSSAVSRYFNALHVLIKDLAIKNWKEHSKEHTRVYLTGCKSTDIPTLPTDHGGDFCIFTVAGFCTRQESTAAKGEHPLLPALAWRCPQACLPLHLEAIPPAARAGRAVTGGSCGSCLHLTHNSPCHKVKTQFLPLKRTGQNLA